VEDRIREGKAAGLRNFPCHGWEENNAWLEAVLAAADLVCWAKLICFAAMPSLARREIAAFRYRVLHVAAQLTRSARRTCLRIDRAWRWAAQIAEGFRRLRLTSPYRVLTITGRRQPAHQHRRCPRRRTSRSRHRQDADRSGPQPPANTKSRSNQAGCGRFRSRVKEGG